MIDVYQHLNAAISAGRAIRRPGLLDALINAEVMGKKLNDEEITGAMMLLITGGFDTTTALTAHALEYLGEHPDQRERLSRERDTLLDSATEEFLRFYTPAPGAGRTISADCVVDGTEFREGERIWLSWAMANRDPSVFPDPDTLDFQRAGNRHTSFGLGVHRCIGSNVARMIFKSMLTAVLDRMPDYVIDPSQTVHYRTIGVIQGMQHLAATFTPGKRLGPSFAETLDSLQQACDGQRLAEPVTVRRQQARVGDDSE
jgi:cytochrome P450